MAVPYVLQLNNGVNAIHLTDVYTLDESAQITYLPNVGNNIQVPIPLLASLNISKSKTIQLDAPNDAVTPISSVYQITQPKNNPLQSTKRGRKKKRKIEEPQKVKEESNKPAPRTRSGRVIKFPKHMEKVFKKVETKEVKKEENDEEIETSDFVMFKENPPAEPAVLSQLDFHQRKRKIAAQYRCPKCLKAYLGKTKMIQHIKKYPDHGPIPQKDNNNVNFEVWNYLVDITQKCPSAQRGIKFCEELTNLLHNVLLLTSALFKKVNQNKNFVEVDKVLGNAIGLSPGFYTFNDNELYKDVTVLKLITTTDFFKPIDLERNNDKPVTKEEQPSKPNNSNDTTPSDSTKEMDSLYLSKENSNVKPSSSSTKPEPVITKESGHVGDNFEKKNETPQVRVDSELLPDHSFLQLSSIRNSVDDLMLTSVDSGGTLLDNSTSSDEVMNVDQFVNERFKRITEPDMELGPCLNLDLPSLDMFQFNTT